MKRFISFTVMTVLLLMLGSLGFVQAAIIPPSGEGQIGVSAIVVCEETALYETTDTSSKSVRTLRFGSHLIVMKQDNGWAWCTDSDSEEDAHLGWIEVSNLLLDPYYYLTEEKTPVYASNDTDASVVADLDEYTILPVLKIDGDWLVVTLDGATGWIHTYAARQDGERFEKVIMIEGMEEVVSYEHIKNASLGFEMDYDHESFVRRSEADRECFISCYDDPADPENYLEVMYSPADAETAAAAITEDLLEEYEVITESIFLDRAGYCIRLDASASKGGKVMPDRLLAVYIIPADDGCRIATAHYFIEGAEGFGVRFDNMMHTFTVTQADMLS